MEIHRLLRTVAIGDGIVIVEDRGRGTQTGKHLAGHHLRVGVEVGDHHVPLSERTCELHPALLENGVIRVVPAVFGIKIAASALHGAKLDGPDGIVQRTECPAARPVMEFGGCVVKAVPGGKVLIFHAAGLGKAVETGAVAHEKLGGFGDREEQQPAVRARAVLKKAGHEVGKLLLREPVVPVHQIFLAQSDRVSEVAGEQVGHIEQVAAVLRFLEKAADLGRAGQVGDPHADAGVLTDGAVELLHQRIHRRAGLLAVDMPEIDSDRVIFFQQSVLSAAGERQKKDC